MLEVYNKNLKYQILYKLVIEMSVSLSSVYQQTQSLRQIEQKFDLAIKQEEKFDPIIQDIVIQASNLSMSESYRLLVLLSKNLTNSSSVARKYGGLYTIKKLILTAYHHFYIFASIRVLAWISNITKFQIKKSEFQRAKLYIKQMSLKGNGDQVYQERQCYKLFKLADQFLPWFSQNIPVHINAPFQYKSTFARTYEQIQPKKQIKSFQHFQQRELNKFEQNFNTRRGHNRELIKQLTDFVSLEVKSLIDQQKYKSQLLREIVKTSDSYCIKAIVTELSTMIEDNKKLLYCLKLTDNLMNVGQVQFIQLTKLYILPPLLGYILPYNFSQNKKLVKPQFTCSTTDEKIIIDCISTWNKITQKVGLSTKFYKLAVQQIQSSKGNVPIVQDKHLGEFLTSVIDMQSVNNDKRPNIINSGVQQQLINVLSAKSGGIKLSNQWKQDTSVINQLSQFKESQISNLSKKSSSSGSAGFGKLLNFQQKINLGNSPNTNTSKKGIALQPQLLTFKDVNQSNQIDQVNTSPFKDSIKLINQKSESFMDFHTSQISKYSQYSIQKVNQPKQQNSQQFLLMQPNQPFSHSKKSMKNISGNGSESGSVVYFSHSQDFPSQNREKSESNPSIYKRSKRPSVVEVKSQKSLKFHNINQQSVSTYRFDSSHISKSSFNNSDIKNFGKQGQQFPATIPKPGFGFKRRQMNLLNANSNGQIVTYQNVLGSQISNKKDNSLSKIIQNNFNSKQLRSSFQSGIEDLSGGRHNFNGSLRLSEGGESAYKQQSSRCKQQRKTYKQTKNLRAPQNEYFQNIKLQNSNKTKQIKGKKTQEFFATESPKKAKMSFSSDQKHLKDQLHKLSVKESSESNNISSNLKNTFLIKNGKSIDKPTKQTVIIDEYANDRLIDLERQLGRALLQKNMKQQELKKKQAQCKILKSKSVPLNIRKMEVLKKEDQIMEILQNQKQGQDLSSKNFQIIKPVSNKNNITDLFLQNERKGSYFPANLPYQRAFVKQILASRCLLIKNENLQLGFNYSQSQDQIGLYLTVYKAFDTIDFQVKPNSLKLQKQVNLSLQHQVAGYQVKIKRKIKGLNSQNKQSATFKQIINRNQTHSFRYPEVCISLINQLGEGFDYKVSIPCSLLNLVKPIQINKEIIERLKYQKVFKAEPLPINQQFIRNHKQKIDKYFPHNLALIGGWYLVGYRFPNHIFGKQEDEFLKFKILNSRFIQFQFFNNPKNPLSQTILNLLTGNSK